MYSILFIHQTANRQGSYQRGMDFGYYKDASQTSSAIGWANKKMIIYRGGREIFTGNPFRGRRNRS